MASQYKYLVGADENGNVTPNAQVATRAKYVEPQSASGTLNLDASRETFYDTITATGPLTITFTGTRLGAGILINLAGNQPITVGGVAVVAGQVVALAGETWKVIQSGIMQTGSSTSTLTVGSLGAATSTTTADLAVTGALDTGAGLAAQPYSFSKDGGTTWTAWQAGPNYQFTGLTPSTSSATSTYAFRHQVRNVSGEQRSGAVVSKDMGVVISWTEVTRATFTAPDGTDVTAVTTTGGQSFTKDSGTLTVAGNRLGGYGEFALPTKTSAPFDRKYRITADYAFTAADASSAISFGFNMSTWTHGIGIGGAGTLTAENYPFATFAWNWIKKTGHPLSGTIQMSCEVKTDNTTTGSVSINGEEVATFSSSDYGSDAAHGIRGAKFRHNAYAGDLNQCYTDNVILERA